MKAFMLFCMGVIFSSFAEEKPPAQLVAMVENQQLIYDEFCDWQELKRVECLIYYNQQEDAVYTILFNDDIEITHIIVLVNKQEKILWSNDAKA